MVLKSHAKINLSLSVNKKLANGLHEIQSFFCLISLFDSISIQKRRDKKKVDKILFKGPFAKNVKNDNNSVKRVLSFLRKNQLISDFYNIKINKKIPVFAGLGGGTSNAAVILKFLMGKKIKKDIFERIVSHVGSDLRLFIQNQGFLKNLKTVVTNPYKHQFYFLLVYPHIKSSTKTVYLNVKGFSKKRQIKKSQTFKEKNLFIETLIEQKNDLQLIVEKKHPIIKEIIDSIGKKKGCYLSRMTGSGTTCFGLFKNKSYLKAALKSLRTKYPKFWFSTAKTI